MTRVMYDSVTVGEIPTDAGAVALYIDGHFENWTTGTDRVPRANHLSIAVSAEHDAACLDIERGDATPQQAPGWVRRQLQRNPKVRPVIYAARDTIPQVLAILRGSGIARDQVRVWSAHIDAGAHICSPRACGASFTADGTQWTFSALGRNLDESLLADDFFPSKPKRKAKPAPIHRKVKGAAGAGALATGILTLLHAFGIVHITPAENSAITTFAASAGGWLTPPKKA